MPAAIVLRQFGLGNLRAETCRWSLVRVTIQNSLRALRDGSILLALEILAHRVRQADFAEIFRRRIRLQGVSRTDLADLIDFVAAHRLEPVVDRFTTDSTWHAKRSRIPQEAAISVLVLD